VNSEVGMKEFNGYWVEPRAFVTGDLPVEAYGVCGGREDFASRECRSMWAGCIDAVDYITTGGLIVEESERIIVPESHRR